MSIQAPPCCATTWRFAIPVSCRRPRRTSLVWLSAHWPPSRSRRLRPGALAGVSSPHLRRALSVGRGVADRPDREAQCVLRPPEHIAGYAQVIFAELAREDRLKGLDRAAFVERLTHFHAEIYAVHPFREGNTRSLRAFLGKLAGKPGIASRGSISITNGASPPTCAASTGRTSSFASCSSRSSICPGANVLGRPRPHHACAQHVATYPQARVLVRRQQ